MDPWTCPATLSSIDHRDAICLAGRQMGGMKALELEYGHNRPIELNETDWYPVWYQGDAIADARVEAWEFIVGGGEEVSIT